MWGPVKRNIMMATAKLSREAKQQPGYFPPIVQRCLTEYADDTYGDHVADTVKETMRKVMDGELV